MSEPIVVKKQEAKCPRCLKWHAAAPTEDNPKVLDWAARTEGCPTCGEFVMVDLECEIRDAV